MGYTTTPTYRVEFTVAGSYWTPSGWNVKRDGRPSEKALAAYVRTLEASTKPGGCNEHLGQTVIRSASIVRQSNGMTVATYDAPVFEVVA